MNTAPALIHHQPTPQNDLRRLKLAVVTETFPPEVNGVAQTISRAIDGLSTNGHQIQLVRPKQDHRIALSPRIQEVLVTGIPIPRYGQLRMGLPAALKLIRLWKSCRPDLIHIVTEGPLGLSALMAGLHLNIPICSEFRTNFHSYCRHYKLAWMASPMLAYLRWFHNRTSCTMVPTNELAAELQACGFKDVKTVSRGVDTTLFSPAKRSAELRREWGIGPDTLAVLNVGRLASEKNLPLVASAFAAIQRSRPDSRLIFVGDGPARQQLEAKLPQAIFRGIRKGEELAAHYASGDLFLFPSVTETFGNVTLEAMASGLPVMAFNCAAAGQLIEHGRNGILVEPGDNARFECAAAAFAADDAALSSIGAEARATAMQNSWPEIIRHIEAVYSTCLNHQ